MTQPLGETVVEAFDDDIGAAAWQTEPDGRPFLEGGHCRNCEALMFPLKPACHSCGSEEISAEAMPREGRLYSYTTLHVGPPGAIVPRSMGYVDLPNGVRVFAHLTEVSQDLIDQLFVLTTMPTARNAVGSDVLSFAFEPAA